MLLPEKTGKILQENKRKNRIFLFSSLDKNNE